MNDQPRDGLDAIMLIAGMMVGFILGYLIH